MNKDAPFHRAIQRLGVIRHGRFGRVESALRNVEKITLRIGGTVLGKWTIRRTFGRRGHADFRDSTRDLFAILHGSQSRQRQKQGVGLGCLHCFVSDGYLTLALLKHTTDGSAPVGLNHFG